IVETFPAQLERPLADVDEDQTLGARLEHLRPATGSRTDLQHDGSLGDPAHQHVVDQCALPLPGSSPLLAPPAPVPAGPAFAVLGGGVAVPAQVGRAEHAAPLL